MRFFDASFSNLDPDGSRAVWRDYVSRHLPRISSRLPHAFREFVDSATSGTPGLNVHDGLLVEFAGDIPAGRAVLVLYVGDQQIGYHQLSLTFVGALRLPSLLPQVREIARRRVEFLHDEADLSESGLPAYRLSHTGSTQPLEFLFTDFAYSVRKLATRINLASTPSTVREILE